MLLLIGFGIESKANELKDENPYRLEQLMGIDEDGNMYVREDTDGRVGTDDGEVSLYTEELKVVNFYVKPSGVTTSYKEYLTGNDGYTYGPYAPDAAYLGTYNGKVRFVLAGVVGEVNENDVELVDVSKVSLSYYISKNGRIYHYINQNLKQTSYGSIDNGPAPDYLTPNVAYLSYDGHYFYNDYETMIKDYQNNVRTNSVNPDKPFYNYFQYLPLRSYSSYTDAELTDIINARVSDSSKLYNTGASFVKHQNAYGVNALLVAGIGINESRWGSSTISQSKNNLFGLNAIDGREGDASVYTSADDCIQQMMENWMSKGYLYSGDSRYYGGFLGNKASGINVKYASDPYWGEKAAQYAWYLDKTSGSKDAYKFTIGIKDLLPTDHNAVYVRSASNTSSNILYKTKTCSNVAVLVLNNQPENGFYKIQSDSVLNAERTAVTKSTGVYDARSMYAYASADYIKIVHTGTGAENVPTTLTGTQPTPPPAPQPPEGAVYSTYKTLETLNYRTGPGTTYSVAGSLPKGTRVKVEEGYSQDANGYTWVKIWYNSNTYYVANKYLEWEPWYQEGVDYVTGKKIMTGLREDYFGLEENLSRAQFAVILWRMENSPKVTKDNNFPDVENGTWYTDAVLWASDKGIITGYTHNGYFGPADDITREQMAVMMYRYAGYKGYSTSARVSVDSYEDGAKVSEFAKEAMSWAVANGIITGKQDGVLLDPQGNATRAECATIIMRFAKKFS